MASSPSPVPQRKYDVFLSFRGKDTRRGFVSHLHKALSDKGIETFIDYKLRQGNEISRALLMAIEESEISLIIFSNDYASSRWCLEELVKIIECRTNYGQIVIPIFYDIDPSSVRSQKGKYANAFIKHERRFKHETVKLQEWRTALQKAADLSGFDFSKFQTEVDLIKKIVECVMIRLNDTMHQNDSKIFVGIHERIAHVESLLRTSSQDVCVIGIWGLAGVGKTTIANLIFHRLRHEYKGSHFLENVREELNRYGITDVKNKLLSKLLGEDVQIDMHTELPHFLKRRLGRKKIFVVLDDVNDPDQLNLLTGGQDWFGRGSRIIMTSRDKHALNGCDKIYEVEALNAGEARQLFNLHAFKESNVDDKRFELSKKMVDYAKGIPMALKVLGSLLYKRSLDEWESEVDKLQKMPCPEIQDVLRLSYDGLDDEEKDIFLYLACFFNEDSKQWITALLDACGYSTTIGLRNLQDKALITVSYEGYVLMHDLIQEMGREIVRDKSRNDPSKWNHLWDPNDIYRVLKNNMGTEAIESILLDMPRMERKLHLRPQAFAGMVKLKFLKFNLGEYSRCMIHLPDEGLELPFDELRYFYWNSYPLTSFPSRTFCVENLVEFHMPGSSIQRLWDGTQDLGSLKVLNLRGCENLLELPDLSKAANLESVYLTNCCSLHHFRCHIPLRSLQYLDMGNCSSFKDYSVISQQMKFLCLSGTAIEKLPSSIGQLNSLKSLYLEDCQSLKTLPSEVSNLRYLEDLCIANCREFDPSNLSILFDGLRCLKYLNLANCCNLFELPDNIGLLSSLEDLSLRESNVETLPSSIKHLSNLAYLSLRDCRRLRSLPELPPFIDQLEASNCRSLERIFTSSSITERYCTKGSEYLLTNCIALDESAFEMIAMDFQLRMKARAYKEMPTSPHFDSVCFPGSKVPSLFSYQTTQDLLSISLDELSPHFKLMGFIFCIVFSQPQYPEIFEYAPVMECKCYWEASDGEWFCYTSRVFLDEGLHLVSDHVYLWYDVEFNLSITERIKGSTASASDHYPKVWFEFNVVYLVTQIIGSGVCPMYISDLQNILGTKAKRSENVGDAQMLSPQSKKLKSFHLPFISN